MKTVKELLFEARPAQLLKSMSGILKGGFFTKRLEVKSTSDGMVGLFRASDGNLYTVHISAIADSKFKGLFKDIISKKS